MKKITKKHILKIFLAVAGATLFAISYNTFIYTANVIPSGFSGLALLLQRVFRDYFNIEIPFTVLNVGFNIIPGIIALYCINKSFTISSFLLLTYFSILTDIIPHIKMTNDMLVAAVFGGIVCGVASGIYFKAGTSTGGTDFIAMSISNKFHIEAFSYIMVFNIILILIQGFIYGFEQAFYSIIFQFANTMCTNMTYKHYEKRTLFVITKKGDEISKMLINDFNRTTTKLNAIGCYSNTPNDIIYVVVTDPELKRVVNAIKRIDDKAFVNVVKSFDVQGNFRYLALNEDI